MSKTSSEGLTPLGEKKARGRTVTLRLKVPADAWEAAKRQAVRSLENRLAAIVTQALQLAAKPEGGL